MFNKLKTFYDVRKRNQRVKSLLLNHRYLLSLKTNPKTWVKLLITLLMLHGQYGSSNMDSIFLRLSSKEQFVGTDFALVKLKILMYSFSKGLISSFTSLMLEKESKPPLSCILFNNSFKFGASRRISAPALQLTFFIRIVVY